MRQTPLDAIPDLSDVQVIVRTEWPGRSPDLIEDQITYPIVTALVSAPGVAIGPGIHRLRRFVRLRRLRGRHRPVLGAEPGSRVSAESAGHIAGWRHADDGARRDRRRLGVPVRARRRKRRAHARRAAQSSGLDAALRPGKHSRCGRSREHRRLRQAVSGQLDPNRLSAYNLSIRSRSSTRFAPATATPKDACSSSPAASTWCVRAGT